MPCRWQKEILLLALIVLALSTSPSLTSAQSYHGGVEVPWIRNLRSIDFPTQVSSIQLHLSRACNPCTIDTTQKATIRGYWTVAFGPQVPSAVWRETPWWDAVVIRNLSCTDTNN